MGPPDVASSTWAVRSMPASVPYALSNRWMAKALVLFREFQSLLETSQSLHDGVS